MAVEKVETGEAGFEWRGRYYPWKVSDVGKDLLLIDKITGMAVDTFFELVEELEDEDSGAALRGSTLLAMIATSIRAGNPKWSPERIYSIVMNMSLSEDVEMIAGDDEEKAVPLAEVAAPAEEEDQPNSA